MAVIWDAAKCGLTDVSEMLTAYIIRSIAVVMDAISFSETSVSLHQTTRRNTPEGSSLHRT
jgi:hypothetical protein